MKWLFMLDDFCKEYFSGEWHRCYDRLGDGCVVELITLTLKDINSVVLVDARFCCILFLVSLSISFGIS